MKIKKLKIEKEKLILVWQVVMLVSACYCAYLFYDSIVLLRNIQAK